MAARGPIVLVPLGPVPPALLDLVAVRVRQAFGCDCIVGIEGQIPRDAFDPGRGQCCSRTLLAYLLERAPADARWVLGLTEQDLFVPVLTFVFGEAQLGGRAAVVSTCRLREEFYLRPPDAALLRQRLLKEVLHELGHVCGLAHCADHGCVMTRSASVGHTDEKGSDFCFRCGIQLGQDGRPTGGA